MRRRLKKAVFILACIYSLVVVADYTKQSLASFINEQAGNFTTDYQKLN
jgi:hypothetical protein